MLSVSPFIPLARTPLTETPTSYRRQYKIRPNRRCVDESAGACPACMESMAVALERWIDCGRGESLENPGTELAAARRDSSFAKSRRSRQWQRRC